MNQRLHTRHGRLRVGLLVIVFSPIIGFEKMILGIIRLNRIALKKRIISMGIIKEENEKN